MKILLVYPPFCAPTMAPYSLAYLKDFLQKRIEGEVQCLDLNAAFHQLRFPEYYTKLKGVSQKEAAEVFTAFDKASRPVYAENHKRIVREEEPEFLAELLERILKEKPDCVAFSFVYNSQCFYGSVLLEKLQEKGIPYVIGGPAVSGKIHAMGPVLGNEFAFLEYLEAHGAQIKKGPVLESVPNFSDFPAEEYLSCQRIIPLKSSSTCFYKQCTFCTHFARVPYSEYPLESLKKTVLSSGAHSVYFIDDMISKERLLALAEMLGPLKVQWWCQLRPTADLLEIFPQLYSGGLRSVCWGVESGNQRILDLMKKGTHIDSAKKVLKESHDAGIINMVYIMFAFPSETKDEFFDTLSFLDENSQNIDLISTSIFGLQRGAKVYEDPSAYGIAKVQEKSRTILAATISYTADTGLQNEEARILVKKHVKQIRRLEKLPHIFNYFKEQTLLWR